MLRPAKKEDAKKAIALLALAMDHFIYKLSGYDDKSKALKVLENFFSQTNNRLSFQNTYIYEQNKEIIAAINFYDGAKADELDAPLNQHLLSLNKNKVLKECEDEFYLDSISVDEKFRGLGIASKLINLAYQKAKIENKKLSLIVEKDNYKAKKLYEKMGFSYVKTKNFYGTIYEYMEKE